MNLIMLEKKEEQLPRHTAPLTLYGILLRLPIRSVGAY